MNNKEYNIPVAVHVGELLREWLDEQGMTSKEFAIRTNKPEKTISNILNGKSRITPETADSFEIVTHIPADYLLRFQANYDSTIAKINAKAPCLRLWEEWGALFPYSDMVHRGWIKNASSAIEKMRSLLLFLGLTAEKAFTLQYAENLSGVRFRFSGKSNRTTHGVVAWIRQGEIISNKKDVAVYSEQNVKEYIPKFKAALCSADLPLLVKLCAEVGIKLVFVENIPSASASGAARWKGNHPLILLSGKGKSLDKLTFNFFHELGHIYLKHCNSTIFIDDSDEIGDAEEEIQANQFATSVLLDGIREFDSNPSHALIRSEASKLKVHPCVVLGHLTHKHLISYKEASSKYRTLQKTIEIDFATINN